MSEFKFACPVCGQHMQCDSSQSGTVMECPTCFQKITAPQAPLSDDPKFIITGTKVGERPVPTIPEFHAVEPEKKSPMVTVIALLLLACVVAAAFVFRGQIFKSNTNAASPPNDEDTSGRMEISTRPPSNQVHVKLPPPPLVAPPANDTNWMLDIATADIPAATAAGRVHGKDFICERAYIESGALMLRLGRNGPVTLGLAINFGVAEPEALANQSVNVTTNAAKAALVTMRYLGDDQKVVKETYTNGYALRIKFNSQSGNRIPGKIYFCAPDDSKSYVMGTFNAEIRRPKPSAPKPSTPKPSTPSSSKPSSATSATSSADNTIWTLNLDEATIPDTPAGGKVHGKVFTAERMVLNGDGLTIRTADFPPTAGITIYLRPNPIESVFGKTLTFETDTPGAPGVYLRWKNAQGQETDDVKNSGYVLRVEFGQPAGDHVPGKIYLCTPDDLKSYVVGNFNAEIVKSKPQ